MAVLDQINAAIAAVAAPLTTAGGSCALIPLPGRVILSYPGATVAWDDCCSGQLTFRVSDLRPVWLDAQGRVTIRNPCSISWWEVSIEVMILRCVQVVSNAGTPPTAAVVQSDGQAELSDMQMILSAIEQSSFDVYDLGPWKPLGPQGGCSGGSFTFMVRIDPDPCS